ncbi:MAG: hypothetical protein KDB14_05500 [Planctomycetales bacterium]|nr:hypothetical protein [Planctomycetales bacterium]
MRTHYRRRSVQSGKGCSPFIPPETWYEPHEANTLDYEIVVEPAGQGYEHVLSPEQIRNRLAQLPEWMLRPLEVVQLSGMTRKKKTNPCYGMQWGSTLYLYPIEAGRVEYFTRPPRPSELIETKMYGGKWEVQPGLWKLIWSSRALEDYYLNNILIHELGHLLDDRNSSYVDRERYAEWFAIEYGYKPTRDQQR